MYLAKEAIARPVGTRNPDPIVAQLEDELFELLNETGIGPMGLGGDVTVLQCHIEHADTHMTLNPVAVNYQCWAARRASAHVVRRRHGRIRQGVLSHVPGTVPRTRTQRTRPRDCPWDRGVLTMAVHEVTFPITDPQEILKLRAGDEVTVQGHIIGIRDRTQIRIFDQGVEPPMDLRGAFLLHTAPGVRKIADGKYEKVCIGTTTSARMVRFTEPLGAQYGVRAICGKGGFPDEAIEPMREHGMVYFAIVGGAAALETTQIEEIEEVAWEELMPECLWKFRVKDFGPLTVGIDAHGNSLYHDVQTAAQETTGGDLCPALTTASSTCRRGPASRARKASRTSSTRA